MTKTFLTLLFVSFMSGCKESVFYLDDNDKDNFTIYKHDNDSISVSVVGLSDGLVLDFYIKRKFHEGLYIASLNASIDKQNPINFRFSNYCSAHEYFTDTVRQVIQKSKFDTCNLAVMSFRFGGSDLGRKKIKLNLVAEIVAGGDTTKFNKLIPLTRKVYRGFSVH